MGIRYLDASAPAAAPKAPKITYLDQTPAYKASDFVTAGIPGLSFGHGANAVKRGAGIQDVPGLVSKAVSGYTGGLPDFLTKRPIAGPLESFMPVYPDAVSRIIPKPITEEGKVLGNELERYGNAAGVGEFASNVAPLAKMGMDAFKLKMVGGPEGAIRRAEDKLIQILDPRIKKLNVASEKELSAPESITKSIPYVKPSKNYEELAGNLGKSKRSAIKARNEIIRGENFKIGDEYLAPLQDEINLLKDPNRTPQTESAMRSAAEMEKVFNSYKEFNQGRGFNRVQAQAHKVQLQRETEPLLKRISAGESVQRSPDELKALDKVRYGLMKMVEGGNPEVKRLNEAYSALKETQGMARNQANLARKVTPTLLDKVPIVKDILHAVASPKQAALKALDAQPSMGKRTKDIAKLFELARPEEINPMMRSAGQVPKSIADASIKAKQLSGPQPFKRLDVSREAGEGFNRINPEEAAASIRNRVKTISGAISNQPKQLPHHEIPNFERLSPKAAAKRMRDFAIKYYQPQGKEIIQPFYGARKTGKKVGFSKPDTIKDAFQIALERLKKR